MSRQPNWKFLGNIGDYHPFDYGGIFIWKDTTGVYPEECEVLDAPANEKGTYTVYRFILERCTCINGVLSNNKFHQNHPAWFARYIPEMASYTGLEPEVLISSFCSDNPFDRADGYRIIGDYFGFIELDHYPLTKLTWEEVKERYKDILGVHEEVP